MYIYIFIYVYLYIYICIYIHIGRERRRKIESLSTRVARAQPGPCLCPTLRPSALNEPIPVSAQTLSAPTPQVEAAAVEKIWHI